MPTFTVHAESRGGAVIHEAVDNILEAAGYVIEFTALPKGLMTKTFLVTDDTGFDVSIPLFDALMQTFGGNADLNPSDVPAEEIQLAYDLAMMKYRRLLGDHVAACDVHPKNTLPGADTFADALDSGSFETALADLLRQAEGGGDDETPSAPETTG